MRRKKLTYLRVVVLFLCAGQAVPDTRPRQCQQDIPLSVPEGGDVQCDLNLSESFADLYWSPALAGPWELIAGIHRGESSPYNSSFIRHISVSNGQFIVTNASKAIAGHLEIVHGISESKCLVSIRLNVTEPAPAPASLARDDRLNGTAAGEPGSQSSRIAEVVVPVMVMLVLMLMLLALGLWRRKKIDRCRAWFRSRPGFPAGAAPSQQAGDAGPMHEMQELAELTRPEDASGGDRSAVLNGKLLGSAEVLNAGGLESGAG